MVSDVPIRGVRLALADQGVDDAPLAADLGERFVVERRARYEVFDDVVAALSELSESYALALVTNGASCLQRDKLAASGLGDYFDAVVVGSDPCVAKAPTLLGHFIVHRSAVYSFAPRVGATTSRGRRPSLCAGGCWSGAPSLAWASERCVLLNSVRDCGFGPNAD